MDYILLKLKNFFFKKTNNMYVRDQWIHSIIWKVMNNVTYSSYCNLIKANMYK